MCLLPMGSRHSAWVDIVPRCVALISVVVSGCGATVAGGDAGAPATRDGGRDARQAADASFRCVPPDGFDQTCTTAADCVGVASCTLQQNGCPSCVDSVINISGQHAFSDALLDAGASLAPCSCWFPGPILCSNGRCGFAWSLDAGGG